MSRVVALFCWAELTWTLLSFTATAEQITAGVIVSLIAALACAPLGPVAGPWRLLLPRRIPPLLALSAAVAWRVVRANLDLTRRIWTPGRPPSGMLTTPTQARTDAELTAVGLLTSLIVNSQLVDVDQQRHRLRFHVVSVGADDPVNRAIEARVLAVTRR
ncbi:Na+/H+ antiporter subunit E [Dactylosporangium sp. CA-139066]|uniref:Na+/H+ antiporter subunit E n=1 Tax=Dactylosporangium sp. CA-139066 TaxID=3239930 RepID=UPI003D909DAD